MLSPNVIESLKKIRLLILDVDGVMTDGRLYFSDQGETLKVFNVKDGLGIKMLQSQGIEIAIISGRSSAMVARRAEELGIKHFYQGKLKKWASYQECQKNLNISRECIAYIGDDVIDRQVMMDVGLAIAPQDAVADIKTISDWITEAKGGEGCVREVCDALLKNQGKWESAIDAYAL